MSTLSEDAVRRGFEGLQNWLGEVEELMAAHTPDSCITAEQITAVASPGETLTTTLSNTLEQVTRAAADPRFTEYPAQQLLAEVTRLRDAWIWLCAEHGFSPQ